MTDQKRREIIKALVYGEAPSSVALAENVAQEDVEELAGKEAAEIAACRDRLREAGYLEGN